MENSLHGRLGCHLPRRIFTMDMPQSDKTHDEEFFDRVYQDVLDNLDEEVEMEIEDRLPEDREVVGKLPLKPAVQDARMCYFRDLFRLQTELVDLQEWVVHTGH